VTKKKNIRTSANGLCGRGHSDLNLMMHSKIPTWWSRFHFYKPAVISWSRNTPFMEIDCLFPCSPEHTSEPSFQLD